MVEGCGHESAKANLDARVKMELVAIRLKPWAPNVTTSSD
jgi:hypothetical protein